MAFASFFSMTCSSFVYVGEIIFSSTKDRQTETRVVMSTEERTICVLGRNSNFLSSSKNELNVLIFFSPPKNDFLRHEAQSLIITSPWNKTLPCFGIYTTSNCLCFWDPWSVVASPPVIWPLLKLEKCCPYFSSFISFNYTAILRIKAQTLSI